jgi:hypothetical protein
VGETMTAVRMDKSGIIALERAMWYARILSILGDNQMTCMMIYRRLEEECAIRNIKCIDSTTVNRYLQDMVKRGTLESKRQRVSMTTNITALFYWKVK